MSKSYYELRSPLTSVQVSYMGKHVRFKIFENHAMAGTLTISREGERDFAMLLAEVVSDDFLCALHTWHDGQTMRVRNNLNLPGDRVVVSEYGEVTNVEDVYSLSGDSLDDRTSSSTRSAHAETVGGQDGTD